MEKLLETFVENTRQLGITVNDFQPGSQAVLNQKINFLVTGLQEIDKGRGRNFSKILSFWCARVKIRESPFQLRKSTSKIAKGSVQKVIIPTEVFAYIDQGKNPTLYTKDCLERALQRNEQVKGKVEVYSQVWLKMTS